MNKIRLLINNCKSEINSFLSRIMGREISHILITKIGDKIKCLDSIELYDSEENKIIVAKCHIRLKTKLVTINFENVEYIIESYTDDIWNNLLNIPQPENIKEVNRLYN